jgi:hypothetical protein
MNYYYQAVQACTDIRNTIRNPSDPVPLPDIRLQYNICMTSSPDSGELEKSIVNIY